MLFNAIFHDPMDSIFQIKSCGHFLVYGPNIDRGCLSDSPRWGGSHKHLQFIFSFYLSLILLYNITYTVYKHIKIHLAILKGIIRDQHCTYAH